MFNVSALKRPVRIQVVLPLLVSCRLRLLVDVVELCSSFDILSCDIPDQFWNLLKGKGQKAALRQNNSAPEPSLCQHAAKPMTSLRDHTPV